MSSNHRTMKLVSFLSSVVAVVSFGLSVFFAQYSVGFYALAFGAALVLIVANDYAPRTRGWEPRSVRIDRIPAPRSAQRLRLAA